jgi:hypothetical protein
VKIRGNPSHIAEKYITLARDSLSSGDVVMAENYLQHAEHYNRIIMSHREQLQSQQENNNNRQNNRSHNNNSNYNNNGDSQPGNDGQLTEASSVPVRGNEPQPRINEQRSREPRENTRSRRNNENRSDRPSRPPRARRNSEGSNGEQPQSATSAPRRRNTNGSNNDGPRITDGQETPGFLKTSVAPAAKRARRSPAADTPRSEKTKAAPSTSEKDNV